MRHEQFLKSWWQRKPLFIKSAVDPARLSLGIPDLQKLAANPDVESRLVDRHLGRWKLKQGPIVRLPTRKEDWTLLVQGVNLHLAAADALLDEFRWLPHARLDDIMISYAVDGGGVGPHTDSYDVFLIQGTGTRRWRIARPRDTTLVHGVPVKLLANFEAEDEFICEPGDLLYLPPQYAHDGTAIGECTTWSVGFRTPGHRELVREFLGHAIDTELCAQTQIKGNYSDPGLTLDKHPAVVPARMTEALAGMLEHIHWKKSDVSNFLGVWLSEPKPTTLFAPPESVLSLKQFSRASAELGLRLHRRTLMLHDRMHVFCNGESTIATSLEGRILRKLADDRRLEAKVLASAPVTVIKLLHAWYSDGWLQIG
jgi:50S ribosomal protein L16 3-hydroxylase